MPDCDADRINLYGMIDKTHENLNTFISIYLYDRNENNVENV